MKSKLQGTLWRLVIFVTVCALGFFALLAIFAELRFDDERTYAAQFRDVSGLEEGNFVRIAGVEVGKVKHVTLRRDALVIVEFSTDPSVVLTEGSRAAIRYDNLIGGRYLALEDGTGSVKPLRSGDTIPVDRTQPPLDLDALIGGFRPLFRAMDPDKVNTLTAQLIEAFQGQGQSIGSLLSHTAAVTSALANRDQLIGDVITNLSTVLGSLGAESDRFDRGVDALARLVAELASRKMEIVSGVAYTDAAAGSIADLLQHARPGLKNTVEQGDRVGTVAVADHEYLDTLINELPDKYKTLARLGLYGDYFSFYLCDVVLKLNGKGGQPVYVKVVGQTSGRCAPK